MSLTGKLKQLYAFARLAQDPNQLEMVFRLKNAEDYSELRKRGVSAMRINHPFANDAFESRPRIGPVDLDTLIRLPKETFGHQYAAMMIAQNLSPKSIPDVDVKNDGDYMDAHLHETHDLWHVLTGFGTDTTGEIGLQGFYAAQINFPTLHAALISAILLNAAIRPEQGQAKPRFEAMFRGYQMGQQSEKIFGFRFRDWFDRPLSELRKELRVVPEPSVMRLAVAA